MTTTAQLNDRNELLVAGQTDEQNKYKRQYKRRTKAGHGLGSADRAGGQASAARRALHPPTLKTFTVSSSLKLPASTSSSCSLTTWLSGSCGPGQSSHSGGGVIWVDLVRSELRSCLVRSKLTRPDLI